MKIIWKEHQHKRSWRKKQWKLRVPLINFMLIILETSLLCKQKLMIKSTLGRRISKRNQDNLIRRSEQIVLPVEQLMIDFFSNLHLLSWSRRTCQRKSEIQLEVKYQGLTTLLSFKANFEKKRMKKKQKH